MPTHYKGNKKEKRTLDTYIKVMRAAGSLTQIQNRILAEYGLTSGQFGTLEVLFHLGPMRQKDLGQKLFSSEGNITFILDNLEKRKLIERVRSIEDRRAFVLHLTPTGEKLIRKVFPQFLRSLLNHFSALTQVEQERLASLAKKLGVHVERTL